MFRQNNAVVMSRSNRQDSEIALHNQIFLATYFWWVGVRGFIDYVKLLFSKLRKIKLFRKLNRMILLLLHSANIAVLHLYCF